MAGAGGEQQPGEGEGEDRQLSLTLGHGFLSFLKVLLNTLGLDLRDLAAELKDSKDGLFRLPYEKGPVKQNSRTILSTISPIETSVAASGRRDTGYGDPGDETAGSGADGRDRRVLERRYLWP